MPLFCECIHSANILNEFPLCYVLFRRLKESFARTSLILTLTEISVQYCNQIHLTDSDLYQ